jgi:D-beta-D-heptose 7-phosphate kinase/D-beta-D-heptose 1-phosphate adenosyltransferase
LQITEKILSAASAAERARQYQKQGLTVGFTNGTFDLCHWGHISSLCKAKGLCDKLFIGVNSDASVKKYKGPGRPVQDQATRARLLAALGCVDHVVVFNEVTAEKLVRQIRPDVIAKEGYTLDQWPEAQWVQSHGGKAVTLPRVEGYSTTNLVKKMASQK